MVGLGVSSSFFLSGCVVLLRHDLDKRFGLPGVWKILEIEESLGVRSTFFVREDVFTDEGEARVFCEKLVGSGWELAMHLRETSDVERALEELEVFKAKFGIMPLGVSPCGSGSGWLGEKTWRVMESLSLGYVCGYGEKPSFVKGRVMPNHTTFDNFVRKYNKRAVEEFFREVTHRNLKVFGILTNPEWFVRSTGGSWKNKRMYRLSKLVNTLLNRKKLGKPYKILIKTLKEKNAKIVKYVDFLKPS